MPIPRTYPRPAPAQWLQRSALALTLAAGLGPTPVLAQAQEQASAWGVSGFGTLALASQLGGNELRFKRGSNQPGAGAATSAATDSRAGIQLNWTGGSQWEAAIQAVGFKRPAGTPLAESIEWAYVGYRPSPNTRLRLGRTSPDIFLFADSRNVGYALPWARPPVDFYGFAPMSSLDGADLEHRWSTDDANWRARIALGSFDTSGGGPIGDRVPLHGRNVLALSLAREEGGLLLKTSYLHTRLQADAGAGPQQLLQGLDQLAAMPVPGLAAAIDPLRQNLWSGGSASYLALAAQYDAGPWTLVAEGSVLKVPGSPLNARRGYASVGYRQGNVTYYGLASRVTPRYAAPATPDVATPLTPILGPQAALQGQGLVNYVASVGALYRYDQSTVGLGLRWDFSPSAALKLQADRFTVHPLGAAAWQNSDGRPAQGTLVSVLVDFVWGQ